MWCGPGQRTLPPHVPTALHTVGYYVPCRVYGLSSSGSFKKSTCSPLCGSLSCSSPHRQHTPHHTRHSHTSPHTTHTAHHTQHTQLTTHNTHTPHHTQHTQLTTHNTHTPHHTQHTHPSPHTHTNPPGPSLHVEGRSPMRSGTLLVGANFFFFFMTLAPRLE